MLLFTLEIYAESKAQFEKKVEIFVSKFNENMTKGGNCDKYENNKIFNVLYPGVHIRQNRIVGVLEVYCKNGELNYIMYNMLRKQYLNKRELKNCLELVDKEELLFEEKEMKKNAIKQSFSLKQYLMPTYTKRKHYMIEIPIMGYHTHINDTLSNEEVATLILDDLTSMQKYHLKDSYLELEPFLSIYKFIDYKNMIAKNKV